MNITTDIEKCRTSLLNAKSKFNEQTNSPSSLSSDTVNAKQIAISNIQECLVEESFYEALRLLHSYRYRTTFLIMIIDVWVIIELKLLQLNC